MLVSESGWSYMKPKLLPALIMAHGGIVMQMGLCIIELKDCHSAKQPKTQTKKNVIKHTDYANMQTLTFKNVMHAFHISR